MNTTINGSVCSIPLNFTAEKTGKTFAYSLILVVSLVGNLIIAFIIYKTQKLRKPINYFIVNIAISDLSCKRRWNEAFEMSSSETNYFLGRYVILFYIPLTLIIITFSIVFSTLKTQIFPGEQAANAQEQRAKRNQNVLKMAIAIV